MLTVISPAKDLDLSPMKALKESTQPELLDASEELVTKLRTLSAKRLGTLMDLSPKLAELNHERYQHWSRPFTAENAKPAAFTFNGEVYRGLKAATLSAADLRFAQQHMRILSGLYGVLRPLDLMQAYRLMMGTPFSLKRGVKDLYAFWGDRITEHLNEALKATGSDTLVNLASSEYFKSVRPTKLKARIITPVFKDKRPGGYQAVMVFAKHHRGAMCRWIIEHRLMDPEELKAYDLHGYGFRKDLSTEA
ncbi:MAG TPA: peroxide stress protein YaaA, partial [Flavobacteriales bacterium]|nr:peroxide stress protein YaaA [Flavobacteriales bacterium]